MKTIRVRNVPDDVHRVLRARAAAAGISLSELAQAPGHVARLELFVPGS